MPTDSDASVVAHSLLDLGAATVGESGGRPMSARVRPVYAGAKVAAPAYPVRCTPGDNLAVHVAVARAPHGCVLVVGVGDERERGYWGEVLTTAAEARGLAGLVIDGCVRDSAALMAHAFPVFATGLALPGATKQEEGEVGARTVVGDVEVAAGDWIVGDADGVTVVAAADLADVLAAAQARAEKEQHLFERLRDGDTTIDLLALDPTPIRTTDDDVEG
jgi:4-hydroxy-4-methyl-2-oxoglutarate aldolase